MALYDQQLHGYRHGHELLSGSLRLSKTDQDTIDRLSDVAGPLFPGQRFEPYLTLYPLPSGSGYVVAMTWQDLEASRSGCVRTRSVIIPIDSWQKGIGLQSLASAIRAAGPHGDAPSKLTVNGPEASYFEPVPIETNVELMEALFLEQRKPTAVFGAVDPDLTAFRLLTAMWGSLRKNFSVSTFAMSPRTINDRSFDLVFAAKESKPRFATWPGRRIEASRRGAPRHPWSETIARGVLLEPVPSIIDDDLGALSSNHGGTEADFRISMLWNDLRAKLKASPNAALGLLDIANSRPVRNIHAIHSIESQIADSTIQAVQQFSGSDAWRFLFALLDKLNGVELRLSSFRKIRNAARELTERAPDDSLENVGEVLSERSHRILLRAIADGVASKLDEALARTLSCLDAGEILELLLASFSLAKGSVSQYSGVSEKLADGLKSAAPAKLRKAANLLLPLLVLDFHAKAASILIETLDLPQLLEEVRLIHRVGRLASLQFAKPLARRAKSLRAELRVAEMLSELPGDDGSDAFIVSLLSCQPGVMAWLLNVPKFDSMRRSLIVSALIESASEGDLQSLAEDQVLAIVSLLNPDIRSHIELIEKILLNSNVDPKILVQQSVLLLSRGSESTSQRLAMRALKTLLATEIGPERESAFRLILGAVARHQNASIIFSSALDPSISSTLVSDNIRLLDNVSVENRDFLLQGIDGLASAIVSRGCIDYSEAAAKAAASMLWDSQFSTKKVYARSSALLLPFLFQRFQEPASPLIASAFPSVYEDLRKAGDASQFFPFLFFVDWDKCKTARHKLVSVFMKSSWRATDIALAAARTGDSEKIMRRIAGEPEGSRRIDEIRQGLTQVPDPWRESIDKALRAIDERGTAFDLD